MKISPTMTISDKNLTSFNEIWEHFETNNYNKPGGKHLISRDRKPDSSDRYIELAQTKHGRNMGSKSSIQKSNYLVLCHRINELYETKTNVTDLSYLSLLEGIKSYHDKSGVYSIRIVGDLPTLVWAVILESLETLSTNSTPLLDQEHYEDMRFEDCWNYFVLEQYDSIVEYLANKGVDTEALETRAEKEGDTST